MYSYVFVLGDFGAFFVSSFALNMSSIGFGSLLSINCLYRHSSFVFLMSCILSSFSFFSWGLVCELFPAPVRALIAFFWSFVRVPGFFPTVCYRSVALIILGSCISFGVCGLGVDFLVF